MHLLRSPGCNRLVAESELAAAVAAAPKKFDLIEILFP